MKLKTHMRIFLVASLIWFVFLLAGMPEYYLQYSDQTMILFVLILLIPISLILVFVFKRIKQKKRMKIAVWYAFYFTVPFFIYDSIYCGVLLDHGIKFIIIFWFLSIYYLIPWVLFPVIATVLNRKYK